MRRPCSPALPGPEASASPAAARTAGGPGAAAEDAAALILEAFGRYGDEFREITARARRRFERREWSAGQDDATERLLLYGRSVDRALGRLEAALGPGCREPSFWGRAKAAYARRAEDLRGPEIAKTFFNSVERRILGTIGVLPEAEFVADDFARPDGCIPDGPYLSYPVRRVSASLLRRILTDLGLAAPFENLERDARLAARELDRGLSDLPTPMEAFDLLPSLFYRNKGAYLVGRIRTGSGCVPVVLALLNGSRGVAVDAVLATSDEASVVFGFSRSYFQVETRYPAGTVAFLRSVLPRKRTDELYTAVGYNRHGKTELYRAVREHLHDPQAGFEPAVGEKGTVMCVFTLSGLNVVFKVIRDVIPPFKRMSREQVRRKYRLVFVRDRVGRLADAQEFEGMEFAARRFAPKLLKELRATAPDTVRVRGDRVVIRHLYTERRMTPLDVYLRGADAGAAEEAIADYGYALRDLAAAGLFAGDPLLKNFGVSRHGRVIFYDYDEVELLADRRFRRLPEPSCPEEELAAGAWFGVAEEDVFPEEWPRLLGIPPHLRDAFAALHADLFDPDWWRAMQERDGTGEVVDFFPYRRGRRLQGPGSGRSR